MNMRQLIEQYIKYRQTLGEQFETNGSVLRTYGRFVGEKKKASSATTKQIKKFVDGEGPVTNSRRKRYDALKGLYLYACSRAFVARNPMPTEVPKWGPSLVPYIYERVEIRALLRSPTTYRYRTLSEPETTKTLLLLLYGTGIRIREAIALDDNECRPHGMRDYDPQDKVFQESPRSVRERTSASAEEVCEEKDRCVFDG